MPTIIDSLVVLLGLDSRQYVKGSKDAVDQSKKTRDTLGRDAKETEMRAKKVAQAYGEIGSSIKGIVLEAAAATGVADLFLKITGNAADVGRLGANLGVVTEQLSAWEGAISRVGGKAEDADNAFRMLVGARESLRLRGTTGHDADFAGLGVGNPGDFKDPQELLMKLADASQRMSRAQFTSRMSAIGFTEPQITLLSRGRVGVEQLLAQQRRLGVVTDEDAKAAERMQSSWSALTSKLQGDVRPAFTGLINDVLHLTIGLENLFKTSDANAKGSNPIKAAIDSFQERLMGKPGNRSLGGHFVDWLGSVMGVDWNKGLLDQGTQSTPGAAPYDPAVDKPRRGAVALDGNNPGGVLNGSFAAGQIGYTGGNGRYAKFDTLEHGLAAQRALLRSYVGRGFDTPWKIAQRWAPKGDGANDPAAYARNIAKMYGIGVNDRISLAQVNGFSLAQARQENHHFGVVRGARQAGRPAGAGSTSTSTSETNIGTIVVNTPAADGEGIARTLPKAIKRHGLVTQANSGLSG